ncbi:hypothetical protein B9Z55_015570 [Caenorhabditis nigoni]|uniref:Uncharacterized protein n=1 Tax=Caenorhabditis nigoni TaxID=1611254 RepID=A0A2G5UB29_9PELO|nr:hypothetical protein B9Z55_015570 [Caenorhabditis nigoni]
MNNDVEYKCLPHAILQAWMCHLKDYGETLDERTRGNRLYKMSLKKRSPNRCAEIHREVSEMKKAAGVVKNQHFDFSDIEKFQTTIFAAKLQIIAIVKDQATPSSSLLFFVASLFLRFSLSMDRLPMIPLLTMLCTAYVKLAGRYSSASQCPVPGCLGWGNTLRTACCYQRKVDACPVFKHMMRKREAAGIAKNQSFDYSDIEKFQATVFAAKLQIIGIVKDQATQYFAGF